MHMIDRRRDSSEAHTVDDEALETVADAAAPAGA